MLKGVAESKYCRLFRTFFLSPSLTLSKYSVPAISTNTISRSLLLPSICIMYDQSLTSPLIRWLRRRSVRIAMFVGLGAAAATAASGQLAVKERELVFRVAPGTASWYAGLPEGVVESALPVATNGKTEHVHTWWWPADRPDAPALLYLHGSRWNLTGQAFRIQQLHDFGFSVLAIDYRGFGQSDGDLPSERTVYEDAHAEWDWLVAQNPHPARASIS